MASDGQSLLDAHPTHESSAYAQSPPVASLQVVRPMCIHTCGARN
jgi:hypothetical protein